MVANSQRNILSVIDITVSYGQIRALSRASIEVVIGEIVALIGANGAGKTTLLHSVLGINKIESGEILFLGESVTGKPSDKLVRSGMFLVPEGGGLFPSMTVLDNLLLGAHHNIYDAEKNLKRVFEWFPILENRKTQIAGTLSGGERQMMSIAGALMSTPTLVMIDEPSIGLAPLIVKEIFEILVNLNNQGYTILLAEQNAWKALKCADRGYVMETGKVVLRGTGSELLNDPGVRQAYLGV